MKHESGIDLRCKFCRILDKIWIFALILVGIGGTIVEGWKWLVVIVIIFPFIYLFNKHIMRKIPTLHGMFGDIL